MNEAGNIEALLDKIYDEVSKYHCDILVVDGGSVDGTPERVKRFAEARTNPKFGVEVIPQMKKHWGAQRGGAIATGMAYALRNPGYDLFVEMDADLAHSPEDLMKGIHAVVDKRCNVAIASKYAPGSRVVGRLLLRRTLSIVYNSLLRTFLSHEVRDYSNGYRFYDRKAVELLCSRRIRYTSAVHLVEALAILIADGYKVVEFPSTYEERTKGVSKISILDYAKALVGASEIIVRYWVEVTRRRRYE